MQFPDLSLSPRYTRPWNTYGLQSNASDTITVGPQSAMPGGWGCGVHWYFWQFLYSGSIDACLSRTLPLGYVFCKQNRSPLNNAWLHWCSSASLTNHNTSDSLHAYACEAIRRNPYEFTHTLTFVVAKIIATVDAQLNVTGCFNLHFRNWTHQSGLGAGGQQTHLKPVSVTRSVDGHRPTHHDAKSNRCHIGGTMQLFALVIVVWRHHQSSAPKSCRFSIQYFPASDVTPTGILWHVGEEVLSCSKKSCSRNEGNSTVRR